MKRLPAIAFALLATLAVGCAPSGLMRQPAVAEVVSEQASAGPLVLSQGHLILNNDRALADKLTAIEQARKTLDLAYYIYADDHTSAVFSEALIEATRRGVRVRLLLDYFSAYKDLDRLAWLERAGNGRLEVRLYNRPTIEIVRDAAFLTLSCADVGVAGDTCGDEKLRAVNAHFDALARHGADPADGSFAGSALFLSALYGRNPQMLAYAITHGQGIDLATVATGAPADIDQTAQLKRLGKLYFRARYAGGVDGLTARIKLAFVRIAFAEQVNPVFAAVSTYLPTSRQNDTQARRDWDFLTEFLHHKLLLADGQTLVLGGRNVEDSYHMSPGPLADKYVFMDTDLKLRLDSADPALVASFDRLWSLPGMVATLDSVRRHAPNDLLMNFDVLLAAQDACNQGRDTACVDRLLAERFVPFEQRVEAVGQGQRELADRYRTGYVAAPAMPPEPIDADAEIYYFENLPMVGGARTYGARHDREAASGKHIHALWRAAMQHVCAAEGDASREIVFHNAYLFLPANLLQDIAAMLDGSRPCAGTNLSLVTNSLDTTDLSIVNLLAVWQLKALADHLAETPASPDAAQLRYYEYRLFGEGKQSLHSKVMLFGDDVFIGSANADARSLIMDSNNGIFIRNAPVFVTSYRDSLRSLMDDPVRMAERTGSLGRATEALERDTERHLDELLARYAAERLSPEQEQSLREEVRAATARVYELSREIMRGNRRAADQFNALFKAI